MKQTLQTSASLAGITIIIAIILSACSAATPSPTQDVSVYYTQAAATISLGQTQTAQALPSATLPPTATDTATPEPSPTLDQSSIPAVQTATNIPAPAAPGFPTSTPVPVDPALARGCYNASFVADVPAWYAPAYTPGARFTKTWRVKNTGTCDWPRGFELIFWSGDRFGTDTTVIDQKVTAGSLADVSLSMTAPELTGVVTSSWMLATDIGKPFGPVLSVSITLPGSLNGGTLTSGGCLSSLLVSDVTIPSGTKLNTNDTFTKTWNIQNTGTCTWNGNFKITYIGGDTLGSDTTKIRRTVLPGGSAEISLDMTAPGTSGTVTSAWQLSSDTGELFGQIFQFSIVVK